MSAAARVVFPAPGSPEIARRLRICIVAQRKLAASEPIESSCTRLASVTFRTVYRRSVADSRSLTGGIAAVSRALPCRTRAWTIGCFVLSWRSVGARSLSTI
jgi:hypothetical protein